MLESQKRGDQVLMPLGYEKFQSHMHAGEHRGAQGPFYARSTVFPTLPTEARKYILSGKKKFTGARTRAKVCFARMSPYSHTRSSRRARRLRAKFGEVEIVQGHSENLKGKAIEVDQSRQTDKRSVD